MSRKPTRGRKAAETQSRELDFAPSCSGDLAFDSAGLCEAEETELPEGWQTRLLGGVGSVRYGLGQPPEEDPAGLPIIRATNVKRGSISPVGLVRIKASSLPAGRNPFLKAGDIIVVRSGAYTGDVAMVTQEWEGAVAGYDLVLSLRDQVDPSFCAFQLLTNKAQGYFRGQRDRSAQPHLNRQQLEATEVLVPPLPEQRAIAGVLRTVQGAKEACERVLAATRQLKQSLHHHLFTYGPVPFQLADRVPLKDMAYGSVPEHWNVVSLRDAVAEIDYGLSAAIPKMPPAGGVNIVSTADVTKDGRVLYHQIRRIEAPTRTVARLTLRSGDMLFNWRNSPELVGKTAIFQEQIEPHIFASFILRIRTDESKTHNLFLKYLLNHYREKRVFVLLARRAVNQANYNRNEISVLEIPLPPLSEQREIARQLAAVDAKLAALASRRAALGVLFTSLLHHLLTARLRLPEFAK